MILPKVLFHMETLVQIIFDKYLADSFCLTIVSEIPLQFKIPISFTYIQPNAQDLSTQLLEVSELGCSDYIICTSNPKQFMDAFEKVRLKGKSRRSNKKLIFLPHNNNSSEDLLKILLLKETRFVADILLILPDLENEDCQTYDLVTHTFVGPTDSLHLPKYLDNWNSCSAGFEGNHNLFPHDMSNLYGKVVKAGCFSYKPYVVLDLDTPLGRDGVDVMIIEEFCRWINCTIELVRDDVHQWGEIYPNRTGVGVLGIIVEDRADIGISGLASWYKEYVYLDFSSTTAWSSVTCVAPAPRFLVSWKMPLLPFSLHTWLGVLFMFIYASLAMTAVQRRSSKSVSLTTFGILVSQSQNDNAGKSWRIRAVTGWLLLTALVLDNAYGAGLSSTFTVPVYEHSVDTVQDILERRMEWGATHDAWTYSLASSQEPQTKQLVSQFKVYDFGELKRRSFTRSMAFSIERLQSGYLAIGEYITEEAASGLRLMGEDFYFVYSTMMMRKSSPYLNRLNRILGRLHQSGLLIYWEKQAIVKYSDNKVRLRVRLSRLKQVDIKALTLHHIQGIYFLYLIGVIGSIIVFFVEIRIKKKKA